MPVYSYRCEKCGHEFDQYQSFDEENLQICPECKKKALFRVYKPARVVFKGSGFYVTDSKSSSSTLSGSNGKNASNGKKESKKTESKKTESKTKDKK